MADDTDDKGTPPKVARLLEEYDMENMGTDLEERWLGQRGERESLRDLADAFNRRLLQRRLREAGRSPLEGEVENLYRLLTDDDVSSGERTRARRDLESDGIDVESLTTDFVSHQAIHTYLREWRGASSPEKDPEERIQTGSETVQKMRNRLRAVTQRTVESLASAGHITLGSATVLVDVRVTCTECNTTMPVEELLSSGGCECE